MTAEFGAVADLAGRLRAEAQRSDERRAMVLAGDRDAGIDAAYDAIEAAGIADDGVTIVSTRKGFRFHRVGPRSAQEVLGSTREAVILDCHDYFAPNALGQVVGAVDGGGLLVLVTPPLDDWPDVRDEFDETLAVPPFDVSDVTGRFRRRLVDTIRQHPGIAVVDIGRTVDADPADPVDPVDPVDPADRSADGTVATVMHDGLTHPSERVASHPQSAPANAEFPERAYEACLTGDQARALRAFEHLTVPGNAVVVEADRGRGKSSAAGLAAAALAADGRDVLVTAPSFRNTTELFERVRELLSTDVGNRSIRGEGECIGTAADGVVRDESPGSVVRYETPVGGVVRFETPTAAAEAVEGADAPDVLVVDEAAAVPVTLLTRFLTAEAVAFCTTIHGYEGAGRGFSVRFKDRLAESGHVVHERRLEQPIRYARDDPVERWAFRALMLDARPAVDVAVVDAVPGDAAPGDAAPSDAAATASAKGRSVGEETVGKETVGEESVGEESVGEESVGEESVEYRALDGEALLADEHVLGEAFGLLVMAHYRTEPNDLARLLDAPNLSLRALCYEGHVIAVALLAREGDLPAPLRAAMYEGSRIRGNMVPDVLTSQLRDEGAGEPLGLRTMRIATHHAVRDRGFGSALLAHVHAEFADSVDYFGVGYGATPRLLRFWRRAGYHTVHVSTTRNDASGEYSAIMVRPESGTGTNLLERHSQAFRDRTRDSLSDAHRDLDADVARSSIHACRATVDVDLSERDWRGVVGASYGPGMYDAAPGAFRDLALAHLVERRVELSDREERLLVRKVLQGRPWDAVAQELGYVSTGQCMRALGTAVEPLVDHYGDEFALAERDRFVEDG